MAKKDFINNPALRFISEAAPEEPEAPKAEPQPEITTPEGYKLNPIYVEKRIRRLQLVLQPSLYERVKTKAAAAGQSVNDYVHALLDEATKED